MKRLAVLLAVMMVLGLVPAAYAAVTPAGEYPITTEPVTLTAWAREAVDITDIEANTMTRMYEEMTGVHIAWTLVPSSEATTKFNLSIASTDYPDLYLGYAITTDQVMMCIEGNVLHPLNDLIDAYGIHAKQAFEEVPEFLEYVTAPDGNIYTLFLNDVGAHMRSPNKMFVYKPWLDQLGLSIPQTTAEFKDMLIAFRDNDVNGNGDPDDEIPMVSSYSAWSGNPLGYFMNPFQLYNENYFYITPSDEIAFVANTEGWKQGLSFLHELYAEGLLAEETFVQDETQLKALVNKADPKEYIVGAIPAAWQGVFVDINVMKWTDYEAVGPLEGPSGLRQAAASSGSFTFRSAISTACQEPEIAYRWLDYWLGYEGSFAHTWGMNEGVDYEWVDKPSFSGQDRAVVRLLGMDTTDNYRWGANMVPKYDRYDIRYAAVVDPENFNTNNTYALVEAAKAYEPYYVSNNLPLVVWCDDPDLLTQVTEMRTMFNEYIANQATAFILGTNNLEGDWDNYVSELESMGLAQYLELLKQYYIK